MPRGEPAIRRGEKGRVFDARQFRRNLDDFVADEPTPLAATGDAPGGFDRAGFESRLGDAFGGEGPVDPQAEADSRMVRSAERAGLGDEIRRMLRDGSTSGEIAERLRVMGKLDPREASRVSRAFAREMGAGDPREARAALPSPVRPMPGPAPAATVPVDEPAPQDQLENSPVESPAPAPALAAGQTALEGGRVGQVITTPAGNKVRASIDPETARKYNTGDPAVADHLHRAADEHAANRPWRSGQPDLPHTRKYENPTRPGAVAMSVTNRKTGKEHEVEFPSEAHAYLWEAGRMAQLAASPDADDDTREQAEANLQHLAEEFASFGLSSPAAVAAAGRAYYRDVNRAGRTHGGPGPILAPESSVFAGQETREWMGRDSPDVPGIRPGVIASISRAMGGRPVNEPYRTTVQTVSAPGSLVGDSVAVHTAVHKDLEAIPESMRSRMWTADQNTGQPVMQGPPPGAIETDPFWRQMSERENPPRGVAIQVPLSRIKVRPALMQHRISHQGPSGESGTLGGIDVYDPEKAGLMELWPSDRDIPEHDVRKGDLLLVGGHNRHGLASRLGVDAVNAIIMDAKSPEEAKLNAAINNIAQGNVDPVDAAKVFRDKRMPRDEIVPWLKSLGASMKKDVMNQGIAMANLPDALWSQVMREYQHGLPPTVPYDKLAVIGGMGLDDHDAANVYRMVARDPRASTGQLKAFGSMVRQAKRQEAENPSAGETDLFGDPIGDPSYMKAAALADAVRSSLASEARLMGQVSKRKAADTLGERGVGQIDADAAQANREHRKNLAATFEREFEMGRFQGQLLDLARTGVSPQKAVALIVQELEKRHAAAQVG